MKPSPPQDHQPLFSFRRENRILKRVDFTRIYREGRKARGRFVYVFFCRRVSDELPWRLGITATRKTGNAVARNRQRRLIREFFRLHQQWVPDGWDFVVNTLASLSRASYHELREDLTRVLARQGFNMPTEDRIDVIGGE